MSFWIHYVRQILSAALIAMPLPAWADVIAQFEPETGQIIISDLTDEVRKNLLQKKDNIRLFVKGQTSNRSMPLSWQQKNTLLVIKPHFSLRPATTYRLELGGEEFDITPKVVSATVPKLQGFTPSQAVIPANTLRFYLSFSEPMARGQLQEMVQLVRHDGSIVESPFLNLETELWDQKQRRATILLDPGRVKQGVGPNIKEGAPLQNGQAYKLVVSELMKSAKGVSLSKQATVSFRVGPAERRAIEPHDWKILAPAAETYGPFSITFDRIMDIGTVQRLLFLQAPDGSRVKGEIVTDGGGWSVTPTTSWIQGDYRLIVDPEREDISGNTPGVPFDAGAGTIGTTQIPTILTFDIAR